MSTGSLAEPRSLAQWLPDLALGLDNLASHKLRSLLTMLGMIFGVAAVVAMLSIGAGAQQKVMAFIEQLGVRNLIVEAREASNWQEFQKVRRTSPGLTLNDYQVIRKNISDIRQGTPRKPRSRECARKISTTSCTRRFNPSSSASKTPRAKSTMKLTACT